MGATGSCLKPAIARHALQKFNPESLDFQEKVRRAGQQCRGAGLVATSRAAGPSKLPPSSPLPLSPP